MNSPKWEKMKKELLKDPDLLKKIIEPHSSNNSSIRFIDGKKYVVSRQPIPQSKNDAIANKGTQYNIEENILTEEKANEDFSLIWNIIQNGKFMEIVRAVAEHNKKEEIKQAEQKGFKKPVKVKWDKLEKMSKDERKKIFKRNRDFSKQIPSRIVISNLDLAETMLSDECGNNIDHAFYCYFQAGRAYEKAINKPFDKAIEHELNIVRSKLEKKESRIEYWGQRIHKQRQKYINQGMSKTGKAIRLALNDIAEQYGKENADDYDRRMNKYDKDKDRTDQSIKEHIRSNYWHNYKIKHNIK
jgi:hypothetical protein